jgi:tRNA(fMet)-specific endonuclease VapC
MGQVTYLLDTNVLSEMMREKPAAALERKLSRYKSESGIPAPVIDELQFGIARMNAGERRDLHQAWLEGLMADFILVPFDGFCAQWHGRERVRLAAIGKTPALYDGLIASIAAANELTLVTRNTGDFAAFQGIKLQNWFKP